MANIHKTLKINFELDVRVVFACLANKVHMHSSYFIQSALTVVETETDLSTDVIVEYTNGKPLPCVICHHGSLKTVPLCFLIDYQKIWY